MVIGMTSAEAQQVVDEIFNACGFVNLEVLLDTLSLDDQQFMAELPEVEELTLEQQSRMELIMQTIRDNADKLARGEDVETSEGVVVSGTKPA